MGNALTFGMDARAHLLLRAAAVVVLVAEALYPRSTPASAPASAPQTVEAPAPVVQAVLAAR